MRSQSHSSSPSTTQGAASAPHTTAAQGSTSAQPAVMATRPAGACMRACVHACTCACARGLVLGRHHGAQEEQCVQVHHGVREGRCAE